MSAITNASGVWPVGYRVLVRPDEIEEKTAGGIIISDPLRDQYGTAQTTGVLVSSGLDAWKEYPRRWAKDGDKVMFAKYGGLELTGLDGHKYRLLNDEQITAVVDTKFSNSNIQQIEKRSRL